MRRPLILIASLLLLPALTPNALAQSSIQGPLQGPLQGIAACSQVTDNNDRLACFDRLAIKVASQPQPQNQPVHVTRPHTGVQPSVPVQVAATTNTVTAQQVAKAKKADFGLKEKTAENFGLKEKAPEKAKRHLFTVKNSKTDRYGQLVFTFANGQVWKQTDTRTRRPFTGAIAIEEALLGSFMLFKKGKGSGIRVKRVK